MSKFIIKKNICSVIIFLMFVAVFFSFIPTAVAEQNMELDKFYFAEKCLETYQSQHQLKTIVDLDKRNEEVLAIQNSGSDVESKLEAIGVYKYSNNYTATDFQYPRLSSGNSPADVELSAPECYFDVAINGWRINLNGKWRNENWETQNMGAQWASNATKIPNQNVGSFNYYGFIFSDANSNLSALNISRTSARIEFEKIEQYEKKIFQDYKIVNTQQVVSTSVNSISSDKGVIFEIQDQMVATKCDAMWYEYTFNHKEFNLTATFNRNFERFKGNITSTMIHTYNEVRIENLKIITEFDSSGKVQNKLSYDVVNKSFGWQAFSGGQTWV